MNSDQDTTRPGLWIAGKDSDNPTLMYGDRPMLKWGAMPELAIFSLQLGSDTFRHQEWFDWLAEHHGGYARVYPESGYIWCDANLPGRLFPFVVDHWQDGHPVVDLQRPDPIYWENFGRVLQACEEHNIVVHLQLYQRCYLMPDGNTWQASYYHPANNVNGIDASADGGRSGYGLWSKTAQDYPDGPYWQIHRTWVRQILQAVGDKRNVMLDLVNEAGDRGDYGMVKLWVERTLDLVDEWQHETGNRLLKGLFVALWDDQEYILGHPRLDLLIYHERHMVGKEDRDVIADRARFRRPAISVHNGPFRRGEVPKAHFRTKLKLDLPETVYRTHYHWTGLMEKVQGLGEYFEDYEQVNLQAPEVVAYGRRSDFLYDFFGSLRDYVVLAPAPQSIEKAPCHYQHLLASQYEAVVYLHTESWGETVPAGQQVVLRDLSLPDGPVAIRLLDPVKCSSTTAAGVVEKGKVEIQLPGFHEGIALHLLPA